MVLRQWSSSLPVTSNSAFYLAVFWAAGLFMAVFAIPSAHAVYYGKGAKPASTNAPDETACQAAKCHAQYPLNSGEGILTLSGVPSRYEPGARYPLTISLAQEGQKRWGFQVTSLDSANRAAGKFVLTDEERTQLRDAILEDGQQRLYVEHTLAGSYMGSKNGPVSWEVIWEAGPEATGPVYFYLAANAANFNKKPWGDYIYTLTDTADGAEKLAK